MKYTINTDDNNFVLSISNSSNDNIELDLSKINLEYLNAYQLIEDVLILNDDKLNEIKTEKIEIEKQNEIINLQENLNNTDYIISKTFEEIMSLDNNITFITDFIKILKNFRTQYKDQLSNRKKWRNRIEELRGE